MQFAKWLDQINDVNDKAIHAMSGLAIYSIVTPLADFSLMPLRQAAICGASAVLASAVLKEGLDRWVRKSGAPWKEHFLDVASTVAPASIPFLHDILIQCH